MSETEVLPTRDWTREEILAWCKEHGKNPAFFVSPEPPANPPAGLAERIWSEEVEL